MTVTRLFRVANPLRDYAWGSTTAIAEAVGIEQTGAPQAEMWLGAHPNDPSILADGSRLDEQLRAHPEQLGAAASQLPFLMKLLAAAAPLSLQVHPNSEQAARGFARDEAAGLPLSDPARTFKDPLHKPEILVALTPFRALCGFRSPLSARDDLIALMPRAMDSGMGADLAAALTLPLEHEALRSAVELILSGRDEIRSLAAAAAAEAETGDSALADTVRWVSGHYRDDPGVIAAALLNRVDLAPREALFLDAGNIHAYLSGFGIEAMAPSDNVLRGGLTPKRIDVAGLLDIVAFRAITPTLVVPETHATAGASLTSYWPPVPEFSVHLVDAEADAVLPTEFTGPSMVIVAAGSFELSVGAESLTLHRGQSLFQATGGALSFRALAPGSTAYLTTMGRAAPLGT